MSGLRYFQRTWDEPRGDEYDSWGTAVFFFAVDEEGYPRRQVECYENGRTLRYDEQHLHDEYGGLGDQALEMAEFAPFEIDAETFEAAWTRADPKNR
jgi:hypothetical protein